MQPFDNNALTRHLCALKPLWPARSIREDFKYLELLARLVFHSSVRSLGHHRTFLHQNTDSVDCNQSTKYHTADLTGFSAAVDRLTTHYKIHPICLA